YGRIARVATGPMADVVTVERIDAGDDKQKGRSVNVTSSTTDLSVSAGSGAQATGSGRIVRTTDASGSVRTEIFDGPFLLRRNAGIWRVSGATYGGAPLGDRIAPIQLEQEGLQVMLRSIVDLGSETAGIFTVGEAGATGRRLAVGGG